MVLRVDGQTDAPRQTHNEGTGSFGRYSVVIVPKGGAFTVGSQQQYEYQVDTDSKPSIWTRFINWLGFDRSIDHEKNEAYIEFIQSGQAHINSLGNNRINAHADDRVAVFCKIITGETKSEYREQSEACESMREWILSMRENSDENNENKKLIGNKLRELLKEHQTYMTDLQKPNSQTRFRNLFIAQKLEDLIEMSSGTIKGWRDSVPHPDEDWHY